MPTISPINWSTLDRYYLYGLLNKLRSSIVGKTIGVHDLHSLIANHIKSTLPIRISKKYDTEVKQGQVWIGGLYYSGLDQEYRKAIEVTFNYHPGTTKLTITAYRWKRICTLFADTVLHEVIHMRQYRVRNFKELPDYPSTVECAKQRADQSYYGNRDEIDAHGFNLACELYDRFGEDYNKAMHYLDHGNHKKNKKSVYYAYLNAFDFDQTHKVIKRLRKRAMRYLPYAQIGKPFKTLDWLYS